MKWFRNILKGASLTGALFVFQACYGSRNPYYEEGGLAPMTFTIISHATGEPLEGIRILGSSTNNRYEEKQELGVTGADGRCKVSIPYVRNIKGPFLTFEDSGDRYLSKDTSLVDLREREITVKLEDIQ